MPELSAVWAKSWSRKILLLKCWEVGMLLTRWLCIAEQQVHIWTQEGVGSGCRARRRRALSRCQSFPVQSL